MLQYQEEARVADTIKGLSEVDKNHEQRLTLFDALEADMGRTPYQLYCVKDENHTAFQEGFD